MQYQLSRYFPPAESPVSKHVAFTYHLHFPGKESAGFVPPSGLYHFIFPVPAVTNSQRFEHPAILHPGKLFWFSRQSTSWCTSGCVGVAFYPGAYRYLSGNETGISRMVSEIFHASVSASGNADELLSRISQADLWPVGSGIVDDALSQMIALKGIAGVEDLAMHYNISVRHFRRLFRQHTGMSPKSYLDLKKLICFYGEIKAGMPFQQAALKSGFYDLSHLHRKVRKYFGVKPAGLKHLDNRIIDELMDDC